MKIDGNRLRAMRENRGWSQHQLAELAELDSRTIQRLEHRGSAALETVKAIAAAFNIDISEFAARAVERPASVQADNRKLLGAYGPLLAALTDALQATHHWRQHFNDLFMFRNFFMRRPDPPLFSALERHAHLASTVSLQLHQDVTEGIRQLRKLDYEVQSFGGHIRSLAVVGYHVAPDVQEEGSSIGNRLCDHIEFYLGRARKEIIARVYPQQAA